MRIDRILPAVALVLSLACAHRPESRSEAGLGPAWRFAGKARVAEGRAAMVVSGSPLASEVGRDILRAG